MKEKRLTGTIKYWNGRKGFGFLETEGQEKQVFVHIKAFTIRKTKPIIGQVVTYTLSVDNQDRTRADNVLYEGEVAPASSEEKEENTSSSLPFIIGAALVVAIVGYLIAKAVISFS